jgi:hypothetical protein
MVANYNSVAEFYAGKRKILPNYSGRAGSWAPAAGNVDLNAWGEVE